MTATHPIPTLAAIRRRASALAWEARGAIMSTNRHNQRPDPKAEATDFVGAVIDNMDPRYDFFVLVLPIIRTTTDPHPTHTTDPR